MAPNSSQNLEREAIIRQGKDSGKADHGREIYESSIDRNGAIHEGSHFSNLLFSNDITATLLELAVLSFLGCLALVFEKCFDVAGSMTFREVTCLLLLKSILNRVYCFYLEACYFAFPQYRTQPPKDHALKKKIDLCGRDMEQLERLVWHDKLTFLSQVIFHYVVYFLVPGFYPAQLDKYMPFPKRIASLVLHHAALSFTMYWLHRALHVHPWLWRNIHSIHHWASHPLSRNTYEDHWLDNLGNEVFGAFLAQLLFPLDFHFFFFSKALRIMESLEKHSGISCWLNLAHSVQRWMPYAQMPHHHDYHHEGYKSCNYSFCAIGGVWDYAFGTRKAGRGKATVAATREDFETPCQMPSLMSINFDDPTAVIVPIFTVPALITLKALLLSLDR